MLKFPSKTKQKCFSSIKHGRSDYSSFKLLLIPGPREVDQPKHIWRGLAVEAEAKSFYYRMKDILFHDTTQSVSSSLKINTKFYFL